MKSGHFFTLYLSFGESKCARRVSAVSVTTYKEQLGLTDAAAPFDADVALAPAPADSAAPMPTRAAAETKTIALRIHTLLPIGFVAP
jgi:hypothetical protein